MGKRTGWSRLIVGVVAFHVAVFGLVGAGAAGSDVAMAIYKAMIYGGGAVLAVVILSLAAPGSRRRSS